MRANQRKNDELRPLSIERGVQPQADSSLLISLGNTRVLCAVTIEESAPPFLKGSGRGWITAEYGMLPCATSSRNRREAERGRTGRTFEIQRLIGRSLRMMADLAWLGERTLRVDCDVINADGGTRTAAITGGALAVWDAMQAMVAKEMLAGPPPILPLAAVSAGLVDGVALLDLDYDEDSRAETDSNFVITVDGRLVEIQASAEGRPFSIAELTTLTGLASKGVNDLLSLWPQREKHG